jgi:uncharacterized protein (UPF0264 family)
MAELLVSVRSVAEAKAALDGGAALIDVKEPTKGSLGQAAISTIRAIRSTVGQCCPVSAALGEIRNQPSVTHLPGVSYLKWGLSELRNRNWRQILTRVGNDWQALNSGCRRVAVSYADWRKAGAPTPADVCAFACENRWEVFLVDTWEKIGQTLLHWLSVDDICRLARDCRRAGVRLALAGSLGPNEIRSLRIAQPSWFAVRGAACKQGCRIKAVDASRVRDLVELVRLATNGASGS